MGAGRGQSKRVVFFKKKRAKKTRTISDTIGGEIVSSAESPGISQTPEGARAFQKLALKATQRSARSRDRVLASGEDSQENSQARSKRRIFEEGFDILG